MRLSEWQKNPILVQKAQKFIHSEFGKDFMQMIKDESPWNNEHPGPGATELDMTRLWERGFGVNYALTIMQSAAISVKEPKQIPQDYGGDKEDERQP